MRPVHFLPALLLLLAAPFALAADADAPDPDVADTPIRATSECLDLTRNPQVYVVNERLLIAKTGSRHFRIDLVRDCPQLHSPTLRLVPKGGARSPGRLCGDPWDIVLTQSGVPCDIRGMKVLDKEEFKRLEELSRER